jgi:hypothetical protein
MKLLLSVVLFVSTQCVLFGQAVPYYGSIGVATYSSSKSTSGISIRFANGVLATLKKQPKVKAVGEVRVLTSAPTKSNLIEAFSASKVDTLAVVVTESRSDATAAFSLEVVQRAGDGIAQTIAMVGKSFG